MDIRNWPLDRIMQLPDCCFGTRWPVCLEVERESAGSSWDISEIALPDRCVLWGFHLMFYSGVWLTDIFRLALGDQLPTSIAMMDAFDPLIPGLGQQGPEPRSISLYPTSVSFNISLRQSVMAQGRRPVMQLTMVGAAASRIQLVLVFSSIPTEVPEWLISGQGRSL